MPHWDVTAFDYFSRIYDLVMPPADASVLRPGLDRATRPLERVVDLGGGTGRAVRALSVPDPLVVDASRGMCRKASEKGFRTLQGDATRLPLEDDSVDAVLVVDALHHFPDQRTAIEAVARVLRPGGVLVVREFDPTTLRGRALVGVEHALGFESTFYPPEKLADLLADAGLDADVTDTGFGYTVTGREPDRDSGPCDGRR